MSLQHFFGTGRYKECLLPSARLANTRELELQI